MELTSGTSETPTLNESVCAIKYCHTRSNLRPARELAL